MKEHVRTFKLLLFFPFAFLFIFGLAPVVVSACFGGNPPPHIASLLDKQMDTFSAVAKLIFGSTPPAEAKSPERKLVSQ
jgi:hypothetical protein